MYACQRRPFAIIRSGNGHNRGFTLFEILVALLIIGLVVGVATLSIRDPAPEKLREETRRLAALITLTQEEAILQARDFGIAFWQHGYSFHEFRDGKWQKIEQDRTLNQHELPQNLRLQLVLEDIDVTMSPVITEKPQVFILSSGELSPFKIRLGFSDRPLLFAELEADALGTLKQTDNEQQDDAQRAKKG